MQSTKMQGTSSVPLIMGIIGAVISLPSALCAAACSSLLHPEEWEAYNAAVETARAGGSADIAGTMPMGTMLPFLLALAAGIIGLIGGILGKRSPKLAGILMLTATGLSAISGIWANPIGILVAILFVIGGAFCFAQKKEAVK